MCLRLCGSELVFIPDSVGVESSWVGVEFTLKVVRLENGIFPTTTCSTKSCARIVKILVPAIPTPLDHVNPVTITLMF